MRAKEMWKYGSMRLKRAKKKVVSMRLYGERSRNQIAWFWLGGKNPEFFS